MAENLGSLTLIEKDYELAKYQGRCLVAIFQPPLPGDTEIRDGADGHPPLQISKDENSDINGIFYARGSFGWTDKERNADFLKYWQDKAEALGYAVAGDTVHTLNGAKTESGAPDSQ